MIDYRKLRPNNINSPEFRHLWLLAFWPLYGIVFLLIERAISFSYTPIEVPLDHMIPFCEYFVIPYYFWFILLAGMHIYTAFTDISAFKKLMYFVIITYTVTTIVYLIFPNMQELRPTDFQNDNILIDIMKFHYMIDTNTNVCPSLHVVGSFAVLFTSWHCERFKTFWWQFGFFASAFFISLSTMFVKQHSAIDVIAGVALSLAVYPIAYILPDKIKKK